MDPLRSSRDYSVLLSVRKRRGIALAQRLTKAGLEHQRCVDEQSNADAAVQHCRLLADHYAAELASRTEAGRTVVLPQLQSGRDHGIALDANLRTAEAKLAKAVGAVSDAMLACKDIKNQLRVNDAHMESLASRLAECDSVIARAKEDLEEEEGTDLRLRTASAAS